MLREGEASENEYREKVKAAADAIVAQGVLNVLKEAPVEELGRSKRGLRVKALREHGYNTVADVAAASVHSLASVYGISEDTALEVSLSDGALRVHGSAYVMHLTRSGGTITINKLTAAQHAVQ